MSDFFLWESINKNKKETFIKFIQLFYMLNFNFASTWIDCVQMEEISIKATICRMLDW